MQKVTMWNTLWTKYVGKNGVHHAMEDNENHQKGTVIRKEQPWKNGTKMCATKNALEQRYMKKVLG